MIFFVASLDVKFRLLRVWRRFTRLYRFARAILRIRRSAEIFGTQSRLRNRERAAARAPLSSRKEIRDRDKTETGAVSQNFRKSRATDVSLRKTAVGQTIFTSD